jgi:hypothetical protein
MLSEQFDPEEFGEGVTKPDYRSLEESSLCGEGHGLLSKIIGVLRDEPVESVFRLVCTPDAYLREKKNDALFENYHHKLQ